MRLAAVSVDLDETHHYFAAHGLPAEGAPRLVYSLALARIRDFACELGLPVTLFVVGADSDGAEDELRAASARGWELANHTEHHPYELTRLPPGQVADEIARTDVRLRALAAERPVGFRAPGYQVNGVVVSVLERLGYEYDSSVLPSPPYAAVKALALGRAALGGRRSSALQGDPRLLLAPRRPYRMRAGAPAGDAAGDGDCATVEPWRRGSGLLELPLQTTRCLRLPVIGTSLTLGGAGVARWLAASVASEPFVNLELHGLDFLDASDGLAVLARHQPDLRIPVSRKRAALAAAVEALGRRGFAFVRLRDAARRLTRRSG